MKGVDGHVMGLNCLKLKLTLIVDFSMPSDYLVLFAQVHDDFRIPELLSVSELFKFNIGFPPKIDTSRPFMILSLELEEHALILTRRCILVK